MMQAQQVDDKVETLLRDGQDFLSCDECAPRGSLFGDCMSAITGEQLLDAVSGLSVVQTCIPCTDFKRQRKFFFEGDYSLSEILNRMAMKSRGEFVFPG